MAAIVVQLGLAMMPLGRSSSACGLTSATTRGTSGSRRHAEELSITTAPAAATFGAYSRELVAPLENNAMSMPEKSAVAVSSTTTSPPFHGKVRAGGSGRGEEADVARRGTSRSARRVRITPPTCPVAPNTPMVGLEGRVMGPEDTDGPRPAPKAISARTAPGARLRAVQRAAEPSGAWRPDPHLVATSRSGIYLHVPFCERRCGYCAFSTVAVGERLDPADAERFLAAAATPS